MLSPTKRTFGTLLLSGNGVDVQNGSQGHVESQHVLQCEHGSAHVGHWEHGPAHRPAQHCSPPDSHLSLCPAHGTAGLPCTLRTATADARRAKIRGLLG